MFLNLKILKKKNLHLNIFLIHIYKIYIYIYIFFSYILSLYLLNNIENIYIQNMNICMSFLKKIYSMFKYDLYKGINIFFVKEFVVDGLYFRVKYYIDYNSSGFLIGYNHYIYYQLPDTIKAIISSKRKRFAIFGLDKFLIGILAREIINLKFPNLYKAFGIRFYEKRFRRKIIKKKLR